MKTFPGFVSFFFSLSLSPSLYFSLSYALIFLYLSVKRRKKRRDLCLCMCVINDDHGWDLQARVYIHRCLTHANYRASNKNREREKRWVMTGSKRDAIYILSLSHFSFLWWRCSVPHSINVYDFCFLPFDNDTKYIHRSTVNRFK